MSVDVYDQATGLNEIGAGVSLGGNGMRVLDALGLAAQVRAVSGNLQRIRFHHWRKPLSGRRCTAVRESAFFVGPGRHLVAYPVRGSELINFVAYVPDPEWTLESWSARSDPAEAAATFAGWSDTVTTMPANAGEVGRWAL